MRDATPPSAPQRETRKLVSAVFCDLVGSTEMGEQLDPESLGRVQVRFYAEMRQAIERHGGRVEKFIGDAVVAIFGVPTLHEDDALRAVSAAAEMGERIGALNPELERDWGTRLRTRIGVNTGEAVVEVDILSGQVLVAGDVMNVAARLEQAAGPGEILLGHQTYALVRDSVQVVPVGPLELKGKSKPVPAWRLLRLTAPHGRQRQFHSPLVSRETELALLGKSLVETRQARAARLVTILGPAGVGKSRLVYEFASSLDGAATVLQGRCLPYGQGITFWPVAEVIRQACGITQEDTAGESRAKIAERLPDSEMRSLVCERLAGVLGLAQAESGTADTFWAIRKLLEAVAHPRPVIVVFDDMHWAEEALLDLVEDIAAQTLEAPILLICLARPDLLEERPTWTTELANATSFALEPLDRTESAHLIENLVGGEPLREQVLVRLTDAAEGNPLFLEELVRMLVDQELLRQKNGTWVATADLSTLAVPTTLRALLGARLDGLTAAARQTLEVASVIGREFTRRPVAELLPPTLRRRLSTHLETLVRGGFILADDGTGLRFHHILIRDVAYESMPKRVRAALHERYADVLAGRAGAQQTEDEVLVGYHLEQAFRLRKQLGPLGADAQALGVRAGSQLALAGRRASGRGDVAGAANLLERAVRLLAAEPNSHELMLELGISLRQTAAAKKARRFLRRAFRAAKARQDARVESYATIERSGLLRDLRPALGWGQPAMTEAEKALHVFEALGDDVGQAKAWRRVGTVEGIACHWAAAGAAFERAREHAQRGKDVPEEAVACSNIFQALVLGPMRAEAGIERCHELLAAGVPHPGVEAVGLAALANLQAMAGRFDDARRLLARSDQIFENLGQTRRMIETSFRAAETEMIAGDPAAAERKLAWAYDIVAPTGQEGYLASLAAARAESLAALERDDEAEKLTVVSERNAGADDPDSQVKWRQVRAKVLARRGEHDAAEPLAREAVRRAEATDALNMRAGALVDLAEVLRLAGLFDGGTAAMLEAADLYAQKGNRVGERNAGAALARFAEHAGAAP